MRRIIKGREKRYLSCQLLRCLSAGLTLRTEGTIISGLQKMNQALGSGMRDMKFDPMVQAR